MKDAWMVKVMHTSCKEAISRRQNQRAKWGEARVRYQLVAELNCGVMVAPLLPLAAAAEDADPLEPRLPHRHGYLPLSLNFVCCCFLFLSFFLTRCCRRLSLAARLCFLASLAPVAAAARGGALWLCRWLVASASEQRALQRDGWPSW